LLKKYPDSRIIFASSSSVNKPQSIYAFTKKWGEDIGAFHKNWVNVRFYNVFGENQPEDSGALVPHLIMSKIRGEQPTIFGNGQQMRDFTYVGDIVEWLNELAFRRISGLVHLGYAFPCSVNDMGRMVFGQDYDPHYYPRRSFDIEHNEAPSSDFPPVYGRREGMQKTIEWYENTYTRNS